MMMANPKDEPKKIFPYDYRQEDLPNGLRLITVPTEYPNVVAVYIVTQTGSRNEVEPGKSGFAHFFEHLMFRGTKNTTPAQYEGLMKRAGASFNASTWDDRTQYHTTFSKEDLDTVLRLEADRFQNLAYAEDLFRTEALAVLGEYNKNSAEPSEKISEVLYNTAFDRHTYKHTTMGFLKDIQDMPNQYAYSKTFFDRYYRPEYTTIIVVGDVVPDAVRGMIDRHWGNWKRGSYVPAIPAETAHDKPRRAHVDWPAATLPWVCVAFRNAAYTDTELDSAALDILGNLGFSANSDLYRRLVIEEQIVDRLGVDNFDHADPNLIQMSARVKKSSDMARVEREILETAESLKEKLVAVEKLETVKKRLRYSFALRLNNSEAIAESLAHYIALRRTPETINRLYDRYAQVTPEDLRRIARKYFIENERTIVTLETKK
ncbi:MAG: insulinase family protein [Candidatus Solibacter usitatus]|nr:insulinase family protein [Candidatus Solibacter usitatus]